MYGRHDIYNSPASTHSVEKIADSIAESFGEDYEWYGKDDKDDSDGDGGHKYKKGKIARITQKLKELLDKEKYDKLHDHAKKLAKVVGKLEDKDSDYEPEPNVKAWVAYGNSQGEASDLQTLLNSLGRGGAAGAASQYVDGGGGVADVTRPGDAAFYGPPPTGAYEYATGPAGYGPEYATAPGGDVNITNIYNQGAGAGFQGKRPHKFPRPGKGTPKPAKPQPAKPKAPSWMTSAKPSKATSPRPFQRSNVKPAFAAPKASPSAKVTTPMLGAKRPVIAKAPARPAPARPAMKAPAKAIGKFLGKSKFGAIEELSRDELFGALPHLSTDAFRPTQGQSALERTSILDPDLDNDIDDALHELPLDARVDAIEEGYGALGSESLAEELSYGALGSASLADELAYGADDIDDELDELEETYGEDEVESGGTLDLSDVADEEVPEDLDMAPSEPSSKKWQRRAKKIGKSSPVVRRDLEAKIDRLGKQYEAARRAGDTGKMRELAKLHAAATSAYREAQKAPELASRQQSLINEKVGAWQY